MLSPPQIVPQAWLASSHLSHLGPNITFSVSSPCGHSLSHHPAHMLCLSHWLRSGILLMWSLDYCLSLPRGSNVSSMQETISCDLSTLCPLCWARCRLLNKTLKKWMNEWMKLIWEKAEKNSRLKWKSSREKLRLSIYGEKQGSFLSLILDLETGHNHFIHQPAAHQGCSSKGTTSLSLKIPLEPPTFIPWLQGSHTLRTHRFYSPWLHMTRSWQSVKSYSHHSPTTEFFPSHAHTASPSHSAKCSLFHT